MTDFKRTPGPLRVISRADVAARLVANPDDGLPSIPIVAQMAGTGKQMMANANFIALCWNAHDPMLAALRRAEAMLREVPGADSLDVLNDVCAAIALADPS